MPLEPIARALLIAEVLACLWLARVAWREGRSENLLFRIGGSFLGVSVAGILAYAWMQSFF